MALTPSAALEFIRRGRQVIELILEAHVNIGGDFHVLGAMPLHAHPRPAGQVRGGRRPRMENRPAMPAERPTFPRMLRSYFSESASWPREKDLDPAIR